MYTIAFVVAVALYMAFGLGFLFSLVEKEGPPTKIPAVNILVDLIIIGAWPFFVALLLGRRIVEALLR